jgi:hypothetical protein
MVWIYDAQLSCLVPIRIYPNPYLGSISPFQNKTLACNQLEESLQYKSINRVLGRVSTFILFGP